ncbi:Protein of unknown function, partial [Cotesia congregata]
GLGKLCELDEDCDEIKHAKCSKDGKCICRMTTVRVDPWTYGPILGGFCWKNESCAADNAVCINNEYILGTHCKNDDACNQVKFAKCSENKVCSCTSNTTAVNPTLCLPVFGGFCWETDESQLGIPCKDNSDCKEILNSICSGNGKCECQVNFKEYNTSACAPLLRESCLKNRICAPLHSSCKDDRCKCDDGFSEYSTDKCLPHYIRMRCDNDNDCSYILNSKCRSDVNICICKSTHKMLNETTCAPLLGQHCKPNEQCAMSNSQCIDNVCQCQSGYRSYNTHCLLVDHKFLYSCDKVLDCGDPWHYICDKDKKCRCNRYNYSINRSTCSPGLKGSCWKDSQCTVNNTSCVNFRCQCNNEFIAVSNNLCMRSIIINVPNYTH